MAVQRDLRGLVAPVDHIAAVEMDADDAWRERCNRQLAKIRAKASLRQRDLAEWIGTTQGHLSDLLNPSKKKMRSKFVERLSVALGVTMPLKAEILALSRDLDGLGDHEGLEEIVRDMRTRLGWQRAKK